MPTTLRRTPLHPRHVAAGARLVPFAGFEMPLQYRSIVDEHRAVRSRAGLFDVSHMGELRVRGRDAARFVQRAFTNDVAGTAAGRARYGLLCLADGGVVDDVTLYCLGAEEYLFCVNAANVDADRGWLEELLRAEGFDCELCDESDDTALLALQGPEAPRVLRALLGDGLEPPRPWRFTRGDVAGVPSLVAATGYTGERGYEIFCPADGALRVWDACVAAGNGGLALAGLGARDTLRTEMAYPLYGHELDRAHNPLEAGLERFCAFGRDFVGERALAAARARGLERRLVGLVLEGRQIARPGAAITAPAAGDAAAGTVTSGTFGPTVERSIAIGYVAAALARVGARLAVEVRGRRVACEIALTPFLDRKK